MRIDALNKGRGTGGGRLMGGTSLRRTTHRCKHCPRPLDDARNDPVLFLNRGKWIASRVQKFEARYDLIFFACRQWCWHQLVAGLDLLSVAPPRYRDVILPRGNQDERGASIKVRRPGRAGGWRA